MAAPWTAEEVVSPALAAELLDEQFPALAPAAVAPLGVGWDNTAYLVNSALVVRFPRRQIAVALLEAEAHLLPWMAPQLPLPVPRPELRGQPSDRFRWPFLGYRLLPGRTACALDLTDDQRATAAAPLGTFLRALHELDASEAERLGAVGDLVGRLDLPTRIPRARAKLEAAAPQLTAAQMEAAHALIAASADIQAPAARAVVHGDLYARHLLCDEAGRLCGVIDWGDVHLGHPAVDLSVAHGFLPPDARLAFLAAYGRHVDAETWRLARFRALFSALAIIDYSGKVGDADLEREGRRALDHVLAEGLS